MGHDRGFSEVLRDAHVFLHDLLLYVPDFLHVLHNETHIPREGDTFGAFIRSLLDTDSQLRGCFDDTDQICFVTSSRGKL